jgi:hypothetical protein
VAFKLDAVNVEVAFAMLVPAVAKLSVDDSHRVTVPAIPLKVRVVEFVPVHTVVLPAIDPPTEAGDTFMVTVMLLTAGHAPLLTTAL